VTAFVCYEMQKHRLRLWVHEICAKQNECGEFYHLLNYLMRNDKFVQIVLDVMQQVLSDCGYITVKKCKSLLCNTILPAR
jgi:hypothetical protein